jgi:hypothetical protein
MLQTKKTYFPLLLHLFTSFVTVLGILLAIVSLFFLMDWICKQIGQGWAFVGLLGVTVLIFIGTCLWSFL